MRMHITRWRCNCSTNLSSTPVLIHRFTRADDISAAVVRGQRAPLAAVGRRVKDGIEHLKVIKSHVAAPTWQQRGDLL
jgi:hypothetical protein